jgi:uncharacterized membrane protein YqaE (UPF0057 family)
VHEQKWFEFKIKNKGLSWCFTWATCKFKSSPCEFHCQSYTNFIEGIFRRFRKFHSCKFDSFENFIINPIAFFSVLCCFAPIFIFIFFALISLAVCLVCYCPPLAILTSALPCLRSKDYGVFQFIEKKPRQTADPSFQGHLGAWHEIGWVRAFFICCVLTCFGFFPGVLFAASVSIYHLLRFW